MFSIKNFITRPLLITAIFLMFGHLVYFWFKYAQLSFLISFVFLFIAGGISLHRYCNKKEG